MKKIKFRQNQLENIKNIGSKDLSPCPLNRIIYTSDIEESKIFDMGQVRTAIFSLGLENFP